MASYIKSKVQQSLSFLLVLVIAFSVFSGFLFLNPSPSYAYNKSDFNRALSGDKDLIGADLIEANLSGAYLNKVDLGGAYLNKANLKGTNLAEAYLSWVDLRGADLRGADLREAYLNKADLREADLREADLTEADLTEAIADSKTIFPKGFDARGAGVRFSK